jgi:hypothetical protein
MTPVEGSVTLVAAAIAPATACTLALPDCTD